MNKVYVVFFSDTEDIWAIFSTPEKAKEGIEMMTADGRFSEDDFFFKVYDVD